MESSISKSFKRIVISGNITVERTDKPSSVLREFILILGPTGAGKSTFIEALANDSTLHISSNRLDGFTQSISAYWLNNVSQGGPGRAVYLVDVPGFADTKISTMSIVTMVKEWMAQNNVTYFDRLLYITPINIVRLPGSQREVLRTFRSLTGLQAAATTTIVSTMWDSIWCDSAKERAESNYLQLQEDVWKENLDGGSRIVKFMNTQESALSALDAAFSGSCLEYLNIEDFVHQSQPIEQTPFGSHLHEDLQSRVFGLKLQRCNIQSEQKSAEEDSDEQLMSVLRVQLEEVDNLLAKFEGELSTFRPPSIAPGNITPSESIAFEEFSSIKIPVTSSPSPISLDLVPFQSDSAPSVLHTTSSMTNPVTPSVFVADRPILAAVPTKRGVFNQVMRAMKKMGRKTD